MISRLVLVGMVAVLGVSLPSQSEGDGWFARFQSWAIARLADWDTCTSRNENRRIIPELLDFSPRRAVQAAGRSKVSVAFEPISVDESFGRGIVDELNRMAEGLEIPATGAGVVESRTDFVPDLSSDSIESKLMAELCRIAETSAKELAPAIPHAPVSHTAQSTLTSEPIEPLGNNTMDIAAELNRLADGIMVRPEPAAVRSARTLKFEPIAPLADSARDIAAELNRLADGIAVRPEPAVAQLARTPKFEPIEAPADLESGIAYELNRASEGLEIPAQDVRKLSDARRPIEASPRAVHHFGHGDGDTGLVKAVRLTRDAALAWMTVLTGPAPVNLTSH